MSSTRSTSSRKPSGMALVVERPDVSREELAEYARKHVMPDTTVMEDHWSIGKGPRAHMEKAKIKRQLDEYLAWCTGKGEVVKAAKRMDSDDVPQWWFKKGCGIFLSLGKVFQSLLAMPGGAAALEWDLSDVSDL